MLIIVIHLSGISEPGGSETILAYIAGGSDKSQYISKVCLLKKWWLTDRLDSKKIDYTIIENDKPYDPVFLFKLVRYV